MWITRVSINNPVFATMVMIGITVLGLFSYSRLRVEQMPDVTLPFLIVQTQYPGASPEAVEIDITKPVENAVNGVTGVKLVRSFTAEGVSSVFVEFRARHRHDAGDAGRARQGRGGPARLPAGREGSARRPRGHRQRGAGGVARRDVAGDRPARADVAHRPDDRQGPRERARRGAHRRARQGDAADPRADQAQRAHRARHRRSTR